MSFLFFSESPQGGSPGAGSMDCLEYNNVDCTATHVPGDPVNEMRKRALTLESHSRPFTSSSHGRCLERRHGNSRRSSAPDQDDHLEPPGSPWSAGLTHSSMAGNLHYQPSRRSCFVDVSIYSTHSIHSTRYIDILGSVYCINP